MLRVIWTGLARATAVVSMTLLMTACGSGGNSDAAASLVGYRIGASDRELVLVVETGPNDEVRPATVLSQNATTVKVEVTMKRAAGIQPLQAVQRSVTVVLDAALSDRAVVAPAGTPLTKLP